MYHQTDIHIGGKMRERRVALGMSQSELANKLGITFQQVQKYESGANRVGGSRLWDIAQALEIPITYFFDGLPTTGGKAVVTDNRPPSERPLSRQSLEVARAINAIPDGDVKEQVVRLVQVFAKSA